jgi:hypothetical protein
VSASGYFVDLSPLPQGWAGSRSRASVPASRSPWRLDVRRRLVPILMATAVALGGGIATAATASAQPNPHSQHGQCVSATAGQHVGWTTGKHVGWNDSLERRNVGGTCPGPEG